VADGWRLAAQPKASPQAPAIRLRVYGRLRPGRVFASQLAASRQLLAVFEIDFHFLKAKFGD
jgi:hypothetical protein